MGWSFRKRVKVLPGVALNFSKSGVSLSAGPRGAKVNVSGRGVRTTVSGPLGLSYRTSSSWGPTPSRGAQVDALASQQTVVDYRRQNPPPADAPFVEGAGALMAGQLEYAATKFGSASSVADAAFAYGIIRCKQDRPAEAIQPLSYALANSALLGQHFDHYGYNIELAIPITPELAIPIAPTWRGTTLALVEAYQAAGYISQAVQAIQALRAHDPEDVAGKLSLAELLVRFWPTDAGACDAVVKLAEGVTNESAIAANLLLYKALALKGMGLADAARKTLTDVLRRKKGRPNELMAALRYERGVLNAETGQRARALKDLEQVYADAPSYRDVGAKVKELKGAG